MCVRVISGEGVGDTDFQQRVTTV